MPDMEAQIDTVCARVGGDLNIIHLATPPVPPAGGVEKKKLFFLCVWSVSYVCGLCGKIECAPGSASMKCTTISVLLNYCRILLRFTMDDGPAVGLLEG